MDFTVLIFAFLIFAVGIFLVFMGAKVINFIVPLALFLTGFLIASGLLSINLVDIFNSNNLFRIFIGLWFPLFMGLFFAILGYFFVKLGVAIFVANLAYFIIGNLFIFFGFSKDFSNILGVIIWLFFLIFSLFSNFYLLILAVLSSMYGGFLISISIFLIVFGKNDLLNSLIRSDYQTFWQMFTDIQKVIFYLICFFSVVLGVKIQQVK